MNRFHGNIVHQNRIEIPSGRAMPDQKTRCNLLVIAFMMSVISTECAAGEAGVDHFRLSEQQFDSLFPGRDELYTYNGLLGSLSQFKTMFRAGSETTRKRELAAFLATISHETGDLRSTEEEGRSLWGSYCDRTLASCPPGRLFFGRGPIQLSWNYNYAAAGMALGHDLLDQPDLVTRDPVIAWNTAAWFWTTQPRAGATPHEAMTGGGGFGEVIRAVNGALECGQEPGSRGHDQMRHRVMLYRKYSMYLGVAPEDMVEC